MGKGIARGYRAVPGTSYPPLEFERHAWKPRGGGGGNPAGEELRFEGCFIPFGKNKNLDQLLHAEGKVELENHHFSANR